MMKKLSLGIFCFIVLSGLFFLNTTAYSCRSWNTACEQRIAEERAFDEAQKKEDARIDAEKSSPSWTSPWTTDPVNSAPTNITSSDYAKWVEAAQKNLNDAKSALDAGPPTKETLDKIDNAQKALDIYQKEYDQAKKNEEAARDAECESSGDCIDKTSFSIDTSLFSIGWNGQKWYDSKTTINNLLGTLIQKLMIALWVIALWVMSIWAGYMIMYHGQDEYLSKWKNIFMWGVTALVVALSSYYLVNLVGYILYK